MLDVMAMLHLVEHQSKFNKESLDQSGGTSGSNGLEPQQMEGTNMSMVHSSRHKTIVERC